MIQVLKSSTFYSSHKSSLMRCISTSSESLWLSWYFIFRQLSGSRASLHSLHPKSARKSAPKIFPGPLLHSLHASLFIPGPLLHSLHPKKTFRARCCTVCTQKKHSGPDAAQSAPKSLHSLHPKKTFRARCCTVCTQSLHSLHRDPKMKYQDNESDSDDVAIYVIRLLLREE